MSGFCRSINGSLNSSMQNITVVEEPIAGVQTDHYLPRKLLCIKVYYPHRLHSHSSVAARNNDKSRVLAEFVVRAATILVGLFSSSCCCSCAIFTSGLKSSLCQLSSKSHLLVGLISRLNSSIANASSLSALCLTPTGSFSTKVLSRKYCLANSSQPCIEGCKRCYTPQIDPSFLAGGSSDWGWNCLGVVRMYGHPPLRTSSVIVLDVICSVSSC